MLLPDDLLCKMADAVLGRRSLDTILMGCCCAAGSMLLFCAFSLSLEAMAVREDRMLLDAFIFALPRRLVKKLALALAFIMNSPDPAVDFCFSFKFQINGRFDQ